MIVITTLTFHNKPLMEFTKAITIIIHIMLRLEHLIWRYKIYNI